MERLWKEGMEAFGKQDYAGAAKSWGMGLDQAQRKGDLKWTALFTGRLGNVCHTMGQIEKSRDYYLQALDLDKKLGDQSAIALMLYDLGNVCTDLNQYETARDYHSQALDLYKKLGDTSNTARSLNNLGLVYRDLGQYEKALDCIAQAYELRRTLGNPAEIARSLNNLGSAYDDLGQYETARDYYQQALDLYKKLGDQRGIARSFNNQGNVYKSLEQYEKARDYHTQALAIYRTLDIPAQLALGLENLGDDFESIGQYEKALDYSLQALELRRNLHDQAGIAFSLNDLGVDYQGMSRYDKALDCHTQAMDLFRKLGNARAITFSLYNLGLDYEKMGQLDKARQTYEQAVQALEDLSRQVGEASQVGVFQQGIGTDIYARYVRFLLARNKPQEALVMVERGRGQGLAKQAAQSRSAFAHLLSPDDARQLDARTQELGHARRLLLAVQQRLESASAAERAALQQQQALCRQRYTEAERQYALLRSRLLAHYPDYSHVQGQQPPTFPELETLVHQNPDTLYLEWQIVDSKTTLLFALSDKDGLKTFTLPVGYKELETLAQKWRSNIDDERLELQTAGEVYQALLGKLDTAGLLAQGRYARLVIVSDGPLLNIPFAALRDSSGKRLIERYALSNSVSLGLLTWRSQTQHMPTATLLCVADPLGAGEQFGQSLIVAHRGKGLTPLPRAREEARAIAALMQKRPGLVALIGPEAREGVVKAQMGQYALLHFATHGLLTVTKEGAVKNGMYAGLLMAQEPADSKEDGILEAREIVDIPLSAQLAVLSACQTAQGQISGGDGLVGLAWAFRAAGCPSIVATQWSVQDAATRTLMTVFYKRLLAGDRKDTALRQAMLTVMHEDSRPALWAAYEVIGDTSPIALPAAK